MKIWWNIIRAEVVKQHRQEYHSYFVYYSLLIWPVLGFFEIYYSYKPFLESENLLAFLATGYLAYNCFWTMVQNAWSMTERERKSGTLEVSYLSPANRMAMNYGKALGAFLQETWMFSCFSIIILIYSHALSWENIILLPATFLLLMVSSTLWGGMLNAVFLYSRDSSIIMNVLDTPMNLFSGTKMPVSCLPIWAKGISMVFPLTYCIQIIRIVFKVQKSEVEWKNNIVALGICFCVMIGLTVWITKVTEKHGRETGEMQFY